MTFSRAPIETAYRKFSFLAWIDEADRSNAGPVAVMQNLDVSTRCRNYFTIMRTLAY